MGHCSSREPSWRSNAEPSQSALSSNDIINVCVEPCSGVVLARAGPKRNCLVQFVGPWGASKQQIRNWPLRPHRQCHLVVLQAPLAKSQVIVNHVWFKCGACPQCPLSVNFSQNHSYHLDSTIAGTVLQGCCWTPPFTRAWFRKSPER